MKFRRMINKNYSFREARLDDSEILSSIQLDYLEKFSTLEIPRSAEKFRIAIGSGLINNEKILVVEEEEEIIGYIEYKRKYPFHSKISYPYVIWDHEIRDVIQKDLVKHILETLEASNFRFVNVDFSQSIENALNLFKQLGFTNKKSIFQSWEGEILPDPSIDIDPFEIRRMKSKDIHLTYDWMKEQLDPNSPLYISKSAYASLLSQPMQTREGWALAYIEDIPVAFVSSLQDIDSDAVVIFGPFCNDDEAAIDARIPLLNELFLYYRLRGKKYVRILRVREFYNDKKLFKTFHLQKKVDILSMIKILN